MKNITGEQRSRSCLAVKIATAGIAIVVILYASAGFLAAPLLLKAKLPKVLSDTFGVTTTLTDVAVNPFALSVTLTGFDMKAGGKALAGFEELYVNVQLSSLFHRAYTFSSIRLVAPEGLVEILPDGSLNWSTLVPAGGARSSGTSLDEAPHGEASPDGEIIPVLIQRLQIDKGRLTFSDLSSPVPFTADLFPIQVSLEDFSTRKDHQGRFNLAATLGKGGELNWKGAMSANPLRSQGTFELRGIILRAPWEYMRDHFNFEITNGSMDAKAQYVFEADTNRFELKDSSLTIKDVTLSETGVPETLISVPILTCQSIGLDLKNKELSIGSITSAHASIYGWRDQGGSINYRTVFGSPPEKKAGTPASSPEDATEEKEGTWLFEIDNLSLEEYGIKFEDRAHATPVCISFEPITLNIKKMTNRKGSQSEIDLCLTVNQTGTIGMKGVACLDPLKVDCSVSVSEIALKRFQPYVDPMAKINIAGGKASLDGMVHYDGTGNGTPSICYRGNLRIDGFDAEDRVRCEDLLKWKSLALSDMEINVSPGKLSIADIVFAEPYARVVIFPDHTVNLAAVFEKEKEEKTEHGEAAPPPAASPAVKEMGEGKEAFPITIDTIRIADGSLNFADLSLSPSFAAGIQDLNGAIKGLSSDPSARANVSLTGAVDRYAPVSIKGRINPLGPKKFIDIAFSFKNMELTTLTPYSGKFAGYPIEKGKMSVDLDYNLDGSKLLGENRIFLNQLTLGERIESPSATKLPVALAIALLKDRQGNIDINLPVKGDLDDPEFSYGQLILKALFNLITKIVTSPFALLGSLFGGGEELNHIDFEYGSAELTPECTKRLDIVARSLYERPALRLEIKSVADRTLDRAALAEKRVTRTLKELKADELRSTNEKVPPTVDGITISEEEYVRLLEKAYEALRGEKQSPARKDEGRTGDTVQTMKQELMDAVSIEDIDLRQLAKERAQQIKGCLLQNGRIENERVFILDVQIDDAAEADKARVVLSLS